MQALCKRFVTRWLMLTVAGLIGLAWFNVLLDPSGAYPGLHLKSVESLRYLEHDRVHKAEMARRGDWQVIILGSSRSKAGLPAAHPFLATNQTCNLSLDGAKFPEMAMIFDFARQHNPLKHVILCLDFYMFLQGPAWILEFPESRFNPRFDRFQYYCKQLIGRASTDLSWAVIGQTLRHYRPVPQDTHGFYNHSIGARTCQRELFNRTLHGYENSQVDPSRLELFRQMVRVCRDQKIDLQIAIMPVHALDVELLCAGGRGSEFEEWKRNLVSVLAEERVEGKFRLWDFTGYAGPPAEPIPPAGDVTSRMKFYFESSHCTPTLGGFMLDAMFGGDGTNQFGVKLDRSNVNAHLARIREDRAGYARTNVAEVELVRRILAKASAEHNKPL